ncbi:MAG: hypothetical protein RLZZ28_1614, partial [Bacteroidota bacterium]
LDGVLGAMVFSGIIWLIILVISLIHLFQRKELRQTPKLSWAVLMILLPFLGLFLYIVIERHEKAKSLLVLKLVGLALCIFLSYYLIYNKKGRDVSQEQGVKLSAQALFDAFKANETAANAKYLDKAIEMSGEVLEITTNQDGKTVVNFKTNDPFFVINCTFKTAPGALKPGQTITFKGICTGYIPDANVVINEGVLVK